MSFRLALGEQEKKLRVSGCNMKARKERAWLRLGISKLKGEK